MKLQQELKAMGAEPRGQNKVSALAKDLATKFKESEPVAVKTVCHIVIIFSNNDFFFSLSGPEGSDASEATAGRFVLLLQRQSLSGGEVFCGRSIFSPKLFPLLLLWGDYSHWCSCFHQSRRLGR